jgi:hypothetical protein
MTTIHDAIVEWEALWHQGRDIVDRQSGKAREPLQLLLGALLYQRWALAGFEEDTFHAPIRRNPAGREIQDLAVGSGDPLSDRHHVGATLHLASASIRFPAAIFKLVEFDFAGLCGTDWNRDAAGKLLPTLRSLGDCKWGNPLTPPLAIAVVLLFRDEFGHGEEGTGGGVWRREREQTVDSLYRCRVVEAQQTLARWAFDRL